MDILSSDIFTSWQTHLSLAALLLHFAWWDINCMPYLTLLALIPSCSSKSSVIQSAQSLSSVLLRSLISLLTLEYSDLLSPELGLLRLNAPRSTNKSFLFETGTCLYTSEVFARGFLLKPVTQILKVVSQMNWNKFSKQKKYACLSNEVNENVLKMRFLVVFVVRPHNWGNLNLQNIPSLAFLMKNQVSKSGKNKHST